MPTRQPTRSVGQTNCIALDLGENAIRVVEMELSGSDTGLNRILRKGSAPLPPHTWNDLAANREAFITALRGALSAAGIAGRSVVACLPRRLVTVRFARLPAAPPDQMKQMVMFEAQQYILFSLDEVVLDYHSLTGPLPGFGVSESDDMESVLLVAARRSLVNELLAIFDKAGLELRQLSASALALAEHARDVLEPTALIDIQPGSMDVAVVADGKLLFTRATALDLEGISPDVAQRKLDEEVARSFTAYQNEFRSKVLSHVYLSGSSATVKDAGRLERSLSGILEMPVSRLHNRLIAATDPELIGYATATGMALQTQPSGLVPISLVPDERAERQARNAKRMRQQVSFVGAAAVLLAVTWYAHGLVQNNALVAKQTYDANQKLKSSKTVLAAVQKKHDKLAALNTELDKGLDRHHNTVDVVVALHSALPPSSELWLTQLSYARGGLITLRGESKNSTAPTELTLALQSCGAFRDVKLVYMGDAQETNLVAAPPPKAEDKAAAPEQPLPTFPAGAQAPGQGAPGFPNMNGGPGGQPGFTTPNGPPVIITPGPPSGQPGGNPGAPPLGAPGTRQFQIPPGANVITPGADVPSTLGSGTTPKLRQRARTGGRLNGGSGPTAIEASTASTAPAMNVRPNTTVTAAPRASSIITTRKPAATKSSQSTKVTRTSFIITCKVNQNSTDLLAGITLTPKGSDNQPATVRKARKHVVGEDNSDDNGDSDAN